MIEEAVLVKTKGIKACIRHTTAAFIKENTISNASNR
jgi:hypothetical protein